MPSLSARKHWKPPSFRVPAKRRAPMDVCRFVTRGRACRRLLLQTVVGLQQRREAAAGVSVMRCATVCRFPVRSAPGLHWSFALAVHLGAHMNAVCVVTVACQSLSFQNGKSSPQRVGKVHCCEVGNATNVKTVASTTSECIVTTREQFQRVP